MGSLGFKFRVSGFLGFQGSQDSCGLGFKGLLGCRVVRFRVSGSRVLGVLPVYRV